MTRSNRQDRWVNWDQLAMGEDWWDVIDVLDEKRLGVISEQKQYEDIRFALAQRLEFTDIDFSQMEDDTVNQTKAPPEKKSLKERFQVGKRLKKYNKRNLRRRSAAEIEEDRKIIKEKFLEIKKLKKGRGVEWIANKFGVSRAVLRTELKRDMEREARIANDGVLPNE